MISKPKTSTGSYPLINGEVISALLQRVQQERREVVLRKAGGVERKQPKFGKQQQGKTVLPLGVTTRVTPLYRKG